MPLVTPLLLDRVNDHLVHWRLRGRQPIVDQDALRAYVASPPEPLHPSPSQLESLRPRQQDSDGRFWEAESPWPGATGRNERWVADRLPAATSKLGVRVGSAVIMLHGWLVTSLHFVLFRNLAARLARQGVDVWLPRLPHHIERTEAGDVSGERCISADLIGSVEALRQAVAETRALAAWLRATGTPRIGVWGTSLGGWVAGLAATLDDELDAVALWAPVADPVQVLWQAQVTIDLREAVRAGGIEPGDRDLALDTLAPGSAPLAVRRDRVMIVGAIHDRIVAPSSLRRMARRWHTDVRWEPHGHISLMAAPKPARATMEFLAESIDSAVSGRQERDLN